MPATEKTATGRDLCRDSKNENRFHNLLTEAIRGLDRHHASKLPFTVAASSNNRFVGQQAAAYPDRVCNGALPAGQRTVDEWFNPAGFVVPAPFALGNEGSNILTGPSLTTLDFGVLRTFPFGEERRLEFRWEAFNLFNTPLFGLPSRDASSAGTIGRITTLAGDPRVMQFALKRRQDCRG